MLDVRRLKILLEVSRHGSFSAAAEALGYTPSAVSQQIATLERESATELVVRGARGVILTAAGRALAEHTEAIVARLAEAENELDGIRRLRSGVLRLASFATAAATILPLAIAALRQSHPGIEPVLRMADPEEAVPALAAGELDIVLSHASGDAAEHNLASVPLLDDPMHVALPRGHRLAGRRRLALRELAAEPWMLGTTECCPDAQLFTNACRDAGFEPRIALQNDDYTAVQGFVAAGVGVALIPDMAAVNVRTDIVVTPISPDPPVRPIAALTSAGAHGSPATAPMLAILQQVSRDWTATRRGALSRAPQAIAPSRGLTPA